MEQDNGGWQPVVQRRRHGGEGIWNSRAEVSIHSVFVDNIPESMEAKGLYKIFSNYGVVMDAYIPNKRRKMTRSRFGFVRYNCSVAADMAIQKANGIWCDDRALKVKWADFGKEFVTKHKVAQVAQPTRFRKEGEGNRTRNAWYPEKTTFAEIVKGRGVSSSLVRTIKAEEIGNGWLYESAIVRLKPSCSVEEFREAIARSGFGDVKVRVGSGRDVVLSFQTVEIMKEKLMRMQEWLKDWCEAVLQWKPELVLHQERYVWLSCYGVPLNLWNCNTFCNIGKVWGAVIGLDEDTRNLNYFRCGKVKIATSVMEPINQTINLECKGKFYPIRVCEEQNVKIQCLCTSHKWRNGDHHRSETEETPITETGSRQEEEDDHVELQAGKVMDNRADVERERQEASRVKENVLEGEDLLRDVSVVAETEMSQDASEVGEACEGGSAGKVASSKMNDDDGSQRVDGDVFTPGFIRSISGSEGIRHEIQLEVDLNSALLKGGPSGSRPGTNLAVDQPRPNPCEGPNKFSLIPIQNIGLGYKELTNTQVSYVSTTQTQREVGSHKRKEEGLLRRVSPIPSKQHTSKGQGRIWRGKQKQKKRKLVSDRNEGTTSLNLWKGVIFRSAVAAISFSIAKESNRGGLVLSEAEASLEIGKALGIDCEGKEDEVISHIQDLEDQDVERARTRDGDAN